jgi:hypothetical protein
LGWICRRAISTPGRLPALQEYVAPRLNVVVLMPIRGAEHIRVYGREPSENVAENLLRDFEDKWWKASREVIW